MSEAEADGNNKEVWTTESDNNGNETRMCNHLTGISAYESVLFLLVVWQEFPQRRQMGRTIDRVVFGTRPVRIWWGSSRSEDTR